MTAGRRYGMRALRIPVEPWRIVAEIDPQTGRQAGRMWRPGPVGCAGALSAPD
jgi:hypothetical protein